MASSQSQERVEVRVTWREHFDTATGHRILPFLHYISPVKTPLTGPCPCSP